MDRRMRYYGDLRLPTQSLYSIANAQVNDWFQQLFNSDFAPAAGKKRIVEPRPNWQ